MPCGKDINVEPIFGGLDARTARGTGRQNDFELVLNLDGSIEEGFKRGMGFRRYLWNEHCGDDYLNQDLHDQMWRSQAVVNIPLIQREPTITTPPYTIWSGRVGLDATSTFLWGAPYINDPQLAFWAGISGSTMTSVSRTSVNGSFSFTTVGAGALSDYTTTTTHGISVVPWSATPAISRYDELLGPLDHVEITITTGVRGDPVRAENLDSGPQAVTVGFNSATVYQFAGAIALATHNPAVSVTVNVFAYDGVTDYAGSTGTASGFSVGTPLSNSETSTITVSRSAAVTDDLVGSGTTSISISATATDIASSSPGPTNLSTQISKEVSSTINFVYKYHAFEGYWWFAVEDGSGFDPVSFVIQSSSLPLDMATAGDMGGLSVNGFGYALVSDTGAGTFRIFRSKVQIASGQDATIVVTGVSGSAPPPLPVTTSTGWGYVRLFPFLPASPWHRWTIGLETNRFALRSGMLYVRVSYITGASTEGQAEASFAVTGRASESMQLDLPGDAHDIVVIRLVGKITSDLVELVDEVADGTGIIVETGEEVCGEFTNVERSDITMLQSVTTLSKKRRIIAATRETIFSNDDISGNWRVIADGLGDDCGVDDRDNSISFKMVMMGNIAIITNGFDKVIGYDLNDQPAGDNLWSADYVAELQALRISSAKVIGKYGGFVLLGDLVADAEVQSSRLIWSDYNNPMGWIPGGNSAAGYHDFGRGEIVLAIEPIGGLIRIYTSQAIYDGQVIDSEAIFAFTEIYRNPDSASLLRYPNTLINAGDVHYYLGADSIYTTTIWDRSPQRVEWMHVAAGIIFNGIKPVIVDQIPSMTSYDSIDKKRCRAPFGGYDTVRQAIWFSWPTTDSNTNNISLVLWPRYHKASVVNVGFTAFANHRPDKMITVRDWIDNFGICDASTQLLPKEGVTCDQGMPTTEYTYLFNVTESAADEMDPGSAIAAMCGFCLNDLCKECDADSRFLMATCGPTDISIKEYNAQCGVREFLTGRILRPFPVTSVGCYQDAGYVSLLQSKLNRYGTNEDKLITSCNFNASVPIGIVTGFIAQIGVTDCPDTTRWSETEECPSCDSDLYLIDEDEAEGSRPTDGLSMPFYEMGEYVTLRLYVDGIGHCFTLSGKSLMIGVERS